jgi:hypothetical protein
LLPHQELRLFFLGEFLNLFNLATLTLATPSRNDFWGDSLVLLVSGWQRRVENSWFLLIKLVEKIAFEFFFLTINVFNGLDIFTFSCYSCFLITGHGKALSDNLFS